jgi:hypothetical protein
VAVVYRAGSAGTVAQRTSVPAVVPSTAQVGDLAFLWLECDTTTATVTPPTGWSTNLGVNTGVRSLQQLIPLFRSRRGHSLVLLSMGVLMLLLLIHHLLLMVVPQLTSRKTVSVLQPLRLTPSCLVLPITPTTPRRTLARILLTYVRIPRVVLFLITSYPHLGLRATRLLRKVSVPHGQRSLVPYVLVHTHSRRIHFKLMPSRF